MIKIIVHPLTEIGFCVKGWIFPLIFTATDKASGLFLVSSAGTDVICQKGSKLICTYFLHAAAHRKFDTVLQFIIDNAGIYLFHLQQEITDKSQNIGIAGIRLDDSIAVIIIIDMLDQGKSRYFQFPQG